MLLDGSIVSTITLEIWGFNAVRARGTMPERRIDHGGAVIDIWAVFHYAETVESFKAEFHGSKKCAPTPATRTRSADAGAGRLRERTESE